MVVVRWQRTLRVELSAVVALTAVQGNDFVANDIVASLQILGDSSSRGEVGLDKVVGGPCSSAAWSDQTSLRDLAPAKSAGSEGGAVTVARSDVVDDGALVAVGPGVPVEGQLGASCDVGVEPGGGRALVAVDVVGAQGSGLDEPKILVQRIPTSSLWP